MSDNGMIISNVCISGKGGGCHASLTEAECLEKLNNWQVEEVKKSLDHFECSTDAEVVDRFSMRFETICSKTSPDISNTVSLANVCKTGGSWGKATLEKDCVERLNTWQTEYVKKRLQDFECSTNERVIRKGYTRFTIRCTGTLKDIEEGKGSVK